jgi:hypothetical protein
MQHPYESALPIIFNNFLANLLGFSSKWVRSSPTSCSGMPGASSPKNMNFSTTRKPIAIQ